MGAVAATRSLLVDAVAYQRQAKGVALTVQHLEKHSGSIGRESQFVWVLNVSLSFEGEEHRGALVDQYLAAQVGLFFKLLDKQLVSAAIEVPDM